MNYLKFNLIFIFFYFFQDYILNSNFFCINFYLICFILFYYYFYFYFIIVLNSDSPLHPIGKLIHYFWRREYQVGDTEHFYLLLWVEYAPVLGESTNEEVAEFILKYVTSRISDKKVSPILHERVVAHQTHYPDGYCLNNKKIITRLMRHCRFGFERPTTETIKIKDAVTWIVNR